MSKYFIKREDGVIIRMEAVTELVENFSGSVTKNPTADQKTRSDSYISTLPKFTLNGVISSVFQPTGQPEKDIVAKTRDIKDTIKNGNLVTLISADRPYENCVITNAELSKTYVEGHDSWRVSLSLEQILVVDATAAYIDTTAINDNLTDDVSSKDNLSNSTTSLTRVNVGNLLGIGDSALPDEDTGGG